MSTATSPVDEIYSLLGSADEHMQRAAELQVEIDALEKEIAAEEAAKLKPAPKPAPKPKRARKSRKRPSGPVSDGSEKTPVEPADNDKKPLPATALVPVTPAAPAVVEPENHDPRTGRFVKGNRASHGNPFSRRLAAAREAFTAAVTPEDLRDLARALFTHAREGDMQAAALLLAYVLGKPTDAPDPDRLDLDEAELLMSAPAEVDVLQAACEGLDAGQVAEFLASFFQKRDVAKRVLSNGDDRGAVLLRVLRRQKASDKK